LEEQNESRQKSKSLQPMLAIWPFARPYLGQLILALFFLALAATATLSLPAAVRQMIDLGFSQANAALISRYFWALFAVATLMGLASGLRFYWVSWLGERVVADIRKSVYQSVLAMSPTFFETTRTGEVISRLNTDTTLIQAVVGSSASIALRGFVMLVGSAILLAFTSPKLALYTGLGIPLVIIPIIIGGRWVRKLSRKSQDSIADFSARGSEIINAVHTVQAFDQVDHEVNRFSDAVEQTFNRAKQRIFGSVVLSVSVIMLTFGGIVFVLWLGAQAVISGTMSPGELSQFILYAVIAAGSVGALSEVWGDVQRAAGAMERIAELLQVEPDIKAPEQPIEIPLSDAGSLSFQNVDFRYPGRPENLALKQINFDIQPGETIALVGPSGAGKSTIFQLILRFYDPENGQIKLNQVNLKDADPAAVRRSMSLVPQDTVIFSSDAMENIRYGQPNSSEEQVKAAAKVARADEFISHLPQQYQTFLGERGVRLSGGQRQRIAIARAVLLNPQILLLDEATSALDAESERFVQQALDQLQKNRTTLVIAHRLATVRQANRILVLDQGELVAQGSHEQLMASSELYARLARLQFSD